MKFPLLVARKYLFSRKSHNAINLITLIAMIGIAVGTAALIIVLSVFNGLSNLLESLFSAMDPDIKIVAAEGKYFDENEALIEQLRNHPDVAYLTRSLEDRVVMQYYDKQAVPVLKGVEANFTEANPIDSPLYIWRGNWNLQPHQGIAQGVFGQGIAAQLAINPDNKLSPVEIKVLNDKAGSMTNLASAIREERLFASGLFSLQKEYDDRYVLVDLDFARRLFDKDHKLSAYELALRDPDDVDRVRDEVAELVGEAYLVQTWYQQHEGLYRVMRNEKFVGYLILTLLLAIAAVNIVGSLTMIVLEKNRDIGVLKSMGADVPTIRRIFLAEGLLVGGIGVTIGMTIAFVFGTLQQRYGILTLQGGESFRINAFPLAMELGDFVLIFFTVMSLSILAAWYPANRAAETRVVEALAK